MKRLDKSFSELPPVTKADWRLLLECVRFIRTTSRKRLLDMIEREAVQSLAEAEEIP